MRALDGNGIEEGEFKTFEMDLIIPSMHSATFENIEKFMNVDVNSFQQSSRDFVIQGEMLKLFLVLQPPKNTTTKLPPKPPKDDLTAHMHPSIGYHVDVRLRNPEDFIKTSATPSSSKTVSKSVMISNPKHGHVRHTPKLNSEYDTETAMMDSDTHSSTSSEATATTATTATSLTATTVTSGTSTPINSPSTASAATNIRDSSEELPRGPLADFIVINSPAGTIKAKNGTKPNFFRLPDGTIIFPIEIPVGVKTKYNNKDISVIVSVARVMQPPAAGNTSGKMINENILHLPFPGSSPMSQHHVTSATKLEKLLSAQYPQYWQYSQYSRGGNGSVFSPPASFGSSFSPNSDSKSNIHGSHSNPNLFGLSSLLRTNSATSNPIVPSTPIPASSSSLSVPSLSNSNSRSDPNIAGLSSSSEDTLSPLPTPSLTSNLSTSTTSLPSRGSSGNLYGMGQIQTSTSSATLSLANMATATGQSGTTNSNLTTNLGVTSGAPVAIKTAQKIVRVLEPLQVRLLQHYTPNALKLGTKRLIPVAVSNTHPTLSITVRSLQLVLSNIPSLEGGNSMAVGPGPDVPYNNVSVTDKYKTSTLDIETFPVVVTPGDEYHFVVSVEPQTPAPSSLSSSSTLVSEASTLMPPPPASAARAMNSAAKRRVIYTLQAQLVITWSIPCSPGSILSIHPLPVAFPSRHDLLVSFDSKSPVRANNIFNVCFTITNLSDYSRDLTFIIPRPVCVPTSSSSPSASPLSPTASNRSLPARFSPPARSNTLPSIRFTPPSTPSSSSTPSVIIPPPRTPSAHNVHQSASTPSFSITASASASSIPSVPFSPTSSSFSSSTPDLSRPLSGPSSARTAVLANDTTVDEEELLVRFGELQANSASMLCLEKTLYVGLVPRNSSVSVNVRYIPIREGLFEIQGLQIFDRANDQMYVVQDTCQLYVIA